MSYTKKPSVVKIDPTVTHLQPDQFDNDDPIQGYPFGTSAMRVTTATGFPETSGDVITSRTTDDTGSQIFIGEKAYIRAFEGSVWSSWRELGESSGGGPVDWDDIINKPSQFPPSPHTHDIEDIIGLQAALDDKASAQSVNELQQEVDEHKADYTQFKTQTQNDMGNKANLLTTNKSNLVEAINEVFTTGNNVKSDTVGALLSVDPNLPITPTSSWSDIIAAISQISTGKKQASGQTNLAGTTKNFSLANGSGANLNFIEVVADFGFAPSIILAVDTESSDFDRHFTILLPFEVDLFPNPGRIISGRASNSASTNTTAFLRLIGNAYTNENGFCLPFVTPASSHTFNVSWVAVE